MLAQTPDYNAILIGLEELQAHVNRMWGEELTTSQRERLYSMMHRLPVQHGIARDHVTAREIDDLMKELGMQMDRLRETYQQGRFRILIRQIENADKKTNIVHSRYHR